MAKKQKVGIDQIHMQNAVKTLAANIRFSSVDNPIRSIVLTSSVPNEGKTTVAISLAEAIANGGNSVLLIECDMRRRSIASALGIHARYGTYAVLSEQARLMDAVVPGSVRGMYVLDSEPHIPNPDVLLSSKRFRKLIATALENFDYVLFDTPPLSAFVDAAVLSTVADGVLLVVGQNVVRRDELAAAYAQLQKADANVLGAVMNLCQSEKSEYYTEYYSKGVDDTNAPSAQVVSASSAPVKAPVAAPVKPAPPAKPAPRAGVRNAARPGAASPQTAAYNASAAPRGAAAPQGLKPLPQNGANGGAKIAPDSTAQFIASLNKGGK